MCYRANDPDIRSKVSIEAAIDLTSNPRVMDSRCIHSLLPPSLYIGGRSFTLTRSPTLLSTMFRALTAALIACSCSLSAQITFTSSGTFVVPPGVANMTVELVGPGGNGASNGGGGGGGGA